MYNWELADPVLNAWVRMRQAWEAMDKALEIELAKRQTTLAQIDVLMVLGASKSPLTPGEIAAYMFREKHSASALLTRMQRAGYIKKTRSRKDQRVVRIKMQPKGEVLLKQAMPAGLGQARKLLKSALSDDEIKQLDDLAKKVRDRALQQLRLKAGLAPATVDPMRLLTKEE